MMDTVYVIRGININTLFFLNKKPREKTGLKVFLKF